MVWYYLDGQEQIGPVTAEELRALEAEGVVKPNTLVWREGMAQWERWANVRAEVQPDDATEEPPLLEEAPANKGTGGQTPVKELRARARQSLEGQWALAIGFFIFMIAVKFGIAIVEGLSGPASFLVTLATAPIDVGVILFFLAMSRRKGDWQPEIGQLFHGFRFFWRALGIVLVSGLYVLLPVAVVAVISSFLYIVLTFDLATLETLLPLTEEVMVEMIRANMPLATVFFLIVFAVATFLSLQVSQCYYLINDRRDLGIWECLNESLRLMRGKKLKYIWMNLSFFGWFLLSLLTLGVGLVLLVPYIMTTHAHFYEDLRDW